MLLLSDFQVPGMGCMMTPKDYPGRISQSSHKAIILHRDDQQDMVLRIDYQFQDKATPEKFAWIVTVPSEPDKYNVANDKLFARMNSWAHELVWERPKAKTRSRSLKKTDDAKTDDAPLIFGKPAKVGPYDIQPVKARGLSALNALNDWLAKNGFPSEDPDHMKYFVKNEFTFLAIKITPPKGDSLSQTGTLPPLHLSFKTEQVYYPLMFSSRQGVFDLQLYLLTDKKLNYRNSAESLKKLNWKDYGYKRNVNVPSKNLLSDVTKLLKNSAYFNQTDNWYLNVLRCEQVNAGNSIATWKQDIYLYTHAASTSNATLPLFIPLGFSGIVVFLVTVLSLRQSTRREPIATGFMLFILLFAGGLSSGCNQQSLDLVIERQDAGASPLQGLDHLKEYLSNGDEGASWYWNHREDGKTTAQVFWNFQSNGKFTAWLERTADGSKTPDDLFSSTTGLNVEKGTTRVSGKWIATLKNLELTQLASEKNVSVPDQQVDLRWLDGKIRIDINGIQLKRHSKKRHQTPGLLSNHRQNSHAEKIEDGGVVENPDREQVQKYFTKIRKINSADQEKKLFTEFAQWLNDNSYKIRIDLKNETHTLSCPYFPPETPWCRHTFFNTRNLDLLPQLKDKR